VEDLRELEVPVEENVLPREADDLLVRGARRACPARVLKIAEDAVGDHLRGIGGLWPDEGSTPSVGDVARMEIGRILLPVAVGGRLETNLLERVGWCGGDAA